MTSSFDFALSEQSKPALNLIEPGGVGWGEVQVIARALGIMTSLSFFFGFSDAGAMPKGLAFVLGVPVGVLVGAFTVWKNQRQIIRNEKTKARMDVNAATERAALAEENQKLAEEKHKDAEAKLLPKFKLSCDPGCHSTDQLDNRKAVWFRLRVEANFTGKLAGCKGRLISIERLSEQGECLETTLQDHPVTLAFSPSYHNDFASKEIDEKVSELLDILTVTENGHIHLGDKEHNPAERFFPEAGSHRMKVTISSNDSLTIGATLNFKWTGSYKDSELILVETY